jgi:hypothetical protein
MGFKLPGKSIQSGTSGHSSALKMVTEQRAASALKMASPAKSPEYDKAAKNDPELGSYVAERKKIKAKYGGDRKKYRASEEYKANQSKINKAYGIDDGYVAAEPTKIEKVEKRATDKVTKIETKAKTKVAEVGENVSKKVAKISKKDARKEFGRGSKEHLAAKDVHLKAKESDRQGEEGGRKQTIFRKISSNINKRRQKRNQDKLDNIEE